MGRVGWSAAGPGRSLSVNRAETSSSVQQAESAADRRGGGTIWPGCECRRCWTGPGRTVERLRWRPKELAVSLGRLLGRPLCAVGGGPRTIRCAGRKVSRRAGHGAMEWEDRSLPTNRRRPSMRHPWTEQGVSLPLLCSRIRPRVLLSPVFASPKVRQLAAGLLMHIRAAYRVLPPRTLSERRLSLRGCIQRVPVSLTAQTWCTRGIATDAISNGLLYGEVALVEPR